MSFRDSIITSRMTLGERFNVLFKRGPQVDEDFWDDLEEALILSDVGGAASEEIVDALRDKATRQALGNSGDVLALLSDTIVDLFAVPDPSPFSENPVCVLFVGINGAGKTTTVGKLAKHGVDEGRKPLIGSADTFRAAAIEQLDVWGERSGVEVVKRDRGSDPASVAFACIERAEELGSDLVLIDTSGRLHTSDELMRELQKVVNVTRKRAQIPVRTVLVIDATTGQNGLQQARKFNEALDLDGIIVTKLDGTAKGGIAVAVSHELGLPILGLGVGEGIEDLQPFYAHEYADALFGDMRDGAFAEQVADIASERADQAEDDVAAGGEEPAATADDTSAFMPIDFDGDETEWDGDGEADEADSAFDDGPDAPPREEFDGDETLVFGDDEDDEEAEPAEEDAWTRYAREHGWNVDSESSTDGAAAEDGGEKRGWRRWFS